MAFFLQLYLRLHKKPPVCAAGTHHIRAYGTQETDAISFGCLVYRHSTTFAPWGFVDTWERCFTFSRCLLWILHQNTVNSSEVGDGGWFLSWPLGLLDAWLACRVKPPVLLCEQRQNRHQNFRKHGRQIKRRKKNTVHAHVSGMFCLNFLKTALFYFLTKTMCTLLVFPWIFSYKKKDLHFFLVVFCHWYRLRRRV